MREPLIPLHAERKSAKQTALLEEARAADSLGPDRYWAWVAERFRWSRHWDCVRDGGFDDLRYFPGGMINVADNCVDRHTENPESADRLAIIWEGEDGDVRRLTYSELRDAVAKLANGFKALGIGKGDV